MQESTEERLAAIESGITRVTKMQTYIFESLFILQKMSVLLGANRGSLSNIERSVEWTDRRMDRFLVLFFGAIAVLGLAASMFSLYFATMNATARILAIVFSVSALVGLILGFLEYHRVRGQSRQDKMKLGLVKEDVDSVEKELKRACSDLAQMADKWKELNVSPEDWVNELKDIEEKT